MAKKESTELKGLAENFSGKKIPAPLIKLLEFQTGIDGFEGYSEGFGVFDDDNRDALESWSEEKEFTQKLFPFAQANGSGSFYALWDNGKDPDNMPVIVFGDEGGVYVFAENILQLMQIITFDSEPMVYDEVSFYKDKDYEPREYLDDYIKWLKKNYNLDPVKKPELLIKSAQKLYKKEFKSWFKKYADID